MQARRRTSRSSSTTASAGRPSSWHRGAAPWTTSSARASAMAGHRSDRRRWCGRTCACSAAQRCAPHALHTRSTRPSHALHTRSTRATQHHAASCRMPRSEHHAVHHMRCTMQCITCEAPCSASHAMHHASIHAVAPCSAPYSARSAPAMRHAVRHVHCMQRITCDAF